MDLSVAVTPLYLGTMAAEHAVQRRRADRTGDPPGSGAYVRADAAASISMGLLSLTTPITAFLVGRVVPFRSDRRGTFGGRLGLGVAGLAVTSAVVTTVADRLARRADESTDASRSDRDPSHRNRNGGRARSERRARRSRRARQVAEVGGVVTVVAGGLVAAATSAALTAPSRMWRRGRQRDLGAGWLPWTIAMIGWDLGYYWNHRLMHEVRALWAIHVPHHSSEHYNLSTALRQPVASAFGVWLPYSLMARFGVRPTIIETSRALNLIYQYWVHTELIGSLGPAERFLSTPSNHRVHHGSNPRYLDRNHGGILIVWDRLFGTFQRELPEEDPVEYGLTRDIGTHRLWTISTHEYGEMLADVAASRSWRDRLGFVLRGPGWAARRRAELADRPHLAAQAA